MHESLMADGRPQKPESARPGSGQRVAPWAARVRRALVTP